MPFWRTRSVVDEPVIELTSWQIYEIPGTGSGRDRHFSGCSIAGGDPGRASSKIMEFDPKSRVGVTRSGRRYKLIGEPGFDDHAFYVWQGWARINRVDPDTVENVTEDYA